ncbi:MAG: hypothetical protein U5Q44_03380 [Dehalococcoidia bacterium]|nr:hypothetical protein [Dehalococcoidia bacterium]
MAAARALDPVDRGQDDDRRDTGEDELEEDRVLVEGERPVEGELVVVAGDPGQWSTRRTPRYRRGRCRAGRAGTAGRSPRRRG